MDTEAFYLINHSWAHPAFDTGMAVASSWDFWWPFLVVGGLAILVFGGFRARMMLLAAGLSIGITDGVAVDSLKTLVGRPRPHEELVGARTLDLAKAKPRFLALGRPLKEEYSHPGIRPPHGNSFPSGHASNNFAMATVVAVFYRRWGWLAFLPAAVVAYSRIYVGSHWPADVLVSCFLGAGIAFFVVAGLDAAWRRWGGRWFPPCRADHPSLLGR
ncbi:MAG: phosphatase PAP2 family protein [Terrimicrobiaceae bacterium]|jgi:undecaprenyl-diphosphatase